MIPQPIDTAPKDTATTAAGEILIFCPRRGWHRGFFDRQQYNKNPRPFWSINGSNSIEDERRDQPTHWMPLPPAPEPASGKI